MFPVPIPGVGAAGAASKVKKLIFRYYEYFLVYFKIFWIIAGILILIFIGIKIYKSYYKAKFKELNMLLYRLYTELMLFKNIDQLDVSTKQELIKSKKESLISIKKLLNNKTRIKKIGKHNYTRILDGLKLIEKDLISVQDQKKLVQHWINLIISCLKY
jgi:hypothetical protein